MYPQRIMSNNKNPSGYTAPLFFHDRQELIDSDGSLKTTATRWMIASSSTMNISIVIVVCLHVGLLWVLINSSSSLSKETVLPTITGVLISMPANKTIKTLEPVPNPKPEPKKLVSIPRKVIASSRAITQVEPVIKQAPIPAQIDDTEDSSNDVAKDTSAPIEAPHADAAHLNNPAPIYPRTSLRLHEEGKVILKVLILANGTVGEVRVKASSGHKRLDQAALKAVKRWRYVPARRGHEAIDFWHQQPIVFSLRK